MSCKDPWVFEKERDDSYADRGFLLLKAGQEVARLRGALEAIKTAKSKGQAKRIAIQALDE